MNDLIATDIGLLPNHWKVIPFNKALKVKGRVGWKGYKTSDLRTEGPVVVGGTNIKANLYLDFSQITYLSREKFEESPEIMLKKGDVILVTRGNGIGDVGYFDGQFSEATINPSLVILSQFIGNPKYLFYYLNSPQGRAQVLSISGGTSIPALYQGYINTLLCPIPTDGEQEIIVDILGSIDEKIDLLHCQTKTLEELAETLFRQWFLEKAEEGWEDTTLSEIAIHFKKSIVPSKFSEIVFKHYSIPAFDEGKKPKQELGSEILSGKYQVLSNSILVSKLNPRTPRIWGIFGDIDETNAICSTEFQVVKPKEDKWYGFTYCFLKSYQVKQELTGAASGTSGSHQRVNPHDIFNLAFQKPPDTLVKAFDNFTMDIFQKIKSNTTQIQTLTQLRDTLLPKLMSGEVRVKK